MKLLDTNILIYASKNEYAYLRQLFLKPNIYVSDITRIETLGYHKITPAEKEYFENVFNVIPSISFSEAIIQKTIALRQQRKMSLGDAIIAATALSYDLTIITANTKDFTKIRELKVENPIV